MNPLSYSHYNLLRSCGQKYYLSVIEKVPEPKQVHFEYGSAMHAGLACALETQDVEAAQDVFQAYWGSVVDTLDFKGQRYSAFDHEQQAYKFLANFTKKYAKDMTLIVGEKRMHGLKGEGTPDALVKIGDKNVLLDFKTSAYNYEKEKTDVSLQLNFYAALLEENGYQVDQLCYFVFNKATGSIQTPYLVEYDRKKALQMIDEMVTYFSRNYGFYEKNPSSCMYGKSLCSYYLKCWGNNEQSQSESV